VVDALEQRIATAERGRRRILPVMVKVEEPGQGLHVRPVREGDFEQWRALFRGYADFSEVQQSDPMAAQTWGLAPGSRARGAPPLSRTSTADWLPWRTTGRSHDRCLRAWAAISTTCSSSRSTRRRRVDLLLARLAGLAGENGWSVVRWITADDNYRGRGKYDQRGTRTRWITYDMPPAPSRG
jgi:hypothetical protein